MKTKHYQTALLSPSVLENGKQRLLKSFQLYSWKKTRPETVAQKLDYIQRLGEYLRIFASDSGESSEWPSWSSQVYAAVLKDLGTLQTYLQKIVQGEDAQLEENLLYLVA
ncbi:MAG: hypothetical protein V1746_08710 [bacterium]